jgi:hypothetical protein
MGLEKIQVEICQNVGILTMNNPKQMPSLLSLGRNLQVDLLKCQRMMVYGS